MQIDSQVQASTFCDFFLLISGARVAFAWRATLASHIGDGVALPDQSNNTEHTSTLRVQNNYPAW